MTNKDQNQRESIGDSRASIHSPSLDRQKMEKIIELERLHLYNHLKPCGAAALRRHLHDLGLSHLPSVSTIGRILAQKCLTNGRTGYYPEEYQ